MMTGLFDLQCVCGRRFKSRCPAPADCIDCAAYRLLSRPVACVETASEKAFYEAEYEPEDDAECACNESGYSEAGYSEFGAAPLPPEEDAAVVALLTGMAPPRRVGVGGLEICIGVALSVVCLLLLFTGGFR